MYLFIYFGGTINFCGFGGFINLKRAVKNLITIYLNNLIKCNIDF